MGQIALQLSQKDQLSAQYQRVALGFILTVIVAFSLAFALNASTAFFIQGNLQDATDSIALHAASALCAGADAEDAAVEALALNSVVHSMNNVNITIANPPPAGTLNAGNPNVVYIELTGEKSNFFNQLVRGEPLAVSAVATASC